VLAGSHDESDGVDGKVDADHEVQCQDDPLPPARTLPRLSEQQPRAQLHLTSVHVRGGQAGEVREIGVLDQ
jgi:hypothetical protein